MATRLPTTTANPRPTTTAAPPPPRTTTVAPPRPTTTVAPPRPSTTVASSSSFTTTIISKTVVSSSNPSTTATSTTTTLSAVGVGSGGGDSGMSGGTIAGLVVGIIVVLVGSVVGGFFLLKQRRKRLMLVGGGNSRNYNGYPEPDLDRPVAPFRRDGSGSRPGSGYHSSHSGFGSIHSNGRSGIFDEKSFHAAAAGVRNSRMVNNNSGHFGNESFTQLSDGTYVATGRRDGDISPSSPTSLVTLTPRGGGSSSSGGGENKERIKSYMSDDFTPERLEQERELDRQQQERLLMMSGEESSKAPAPGGPHGYPQPPFRGNHPGGSGEFNRPMSYNSHPYQPQQPMYPGIIQRPFSQYNPQQQHNYPFPPPIRTSQGGPNLRPIAQHQHGASSISVHSSFGQASQTNLSQSGEKHEIDDSSDITALQPLSTNPSISPGSRSIPSPDTTIISPASEVSGYGKSSFEHSISSVGYNNSVSNIGNLNAAAPTVGGAPPLPNITKPK